MLDHFSYGCMQPAQAAGALAVFVASTAHWLAECSSNATNTTRLDSWTILMSCITSTVSVLCDGWLSVLEV